MADVRSLKVLGRFSKAKVIFRSVGKTWYSSDVIKKEGIFERMKKYVLGEEAPSKDTAEIEDSYFQLSKVTEPPVYSMETHEIIDKLENIVTEAIPDVGDKWQNESVSDQVIKYKVLSKCYEEFGLLVPNYQLIEMNSVGDVIQYFTSAKPKDTRTFRSIDMANLPPNLTIGGAVPWKVASQKL